MLFCCSYQPWTENPVSHATFDQIFQWQACWSVPSSFNSSGSLVCKNTIVCPKLFVLIILTDCKRHVSTHPGDSSWIRSPLNRETNHIYSPSGRRYCIPCTCRWIATRLCPLSRLPIPNAPQLRCWSSEQGFATPGSWCRSTTWLSARLPSPKWMIFPGHSVHLCECSVGQWSQTGIEQASLAIYHVWICDKHLVVPLQGASFQTHVIYHLHTN